MDIIAYLFRIPLGSRTRKTNFGSKFGSFISFASFEISQNLIVLIIGTLSLHTRDAWSELTGSQWNLQPSIVSDWSEWQNGGLHRRRVLYRKLKLPFRSRIWCKVKFFDSSVHCFELSSKSWKLQLSFFTSDSYFSSDLSSHPYLWNSINGSNW